MFKDLRWGPAFKRAGVFVVIWLGLVSAMSIAFPQSFSVDQQQLPSLAINAVMFFFLFSFIFAITNRSRERRMQELQAQKKSKPDKPARDEDPDSSLKGQRNPNTSRKKARRKR